MFSQFSNYKFKNKHTPKPVYWNLFGMLKRHGKEEVDILILHQVTERIYTRYP